MIWPASKPRSLPKSPRLSRSPRQEPGSRSSSSRASRMPRRPLSAGRILTAPWSTIEFTYRDAVREAIRDALHRDEHVFLMGEDVGRYGGCYAVSKGFLAEFGPDRIRDTPLSESGFTGAGIGAAMAGLRPIFRA